MSCECGDENCNFDIDAEMKPVLEKVESVKEEVGDPKSLSDMITFFAMVTTEENVAALLNKFLDTFSVIAAAPLNQEERKAFNVLTKSIADGSARAERFFQK